MSRYSKIKNKRGIIISGNGQDNNHVTQHPQLARFSKHEEMYWMALLYCEAAACVCLRIIIILISSVHFFCKGATVWEFVPVGSSLCFPDGNGFYIAVRDTNINQKTQRNGHSRFKSLSFVVIARRQSQCMNIRGRCHLSQLGHTKLPSVLRLSPRLSPFF